MGMIDGKICLVTGGASNPGLGHAIAHKLASEGATIIVTDVDGEGDAQIYRIIRNGAHFAVVLYDGDDDEVGETFAVDVSIVSADYEEYAFVQFQINTPDDKWSADEAYTLGYGTAIDSLETAQVTLFETDTDTAGTTDTDAGTFVSGDAAGTAQK